MAVETILRGVTVVDVRDGTLQAGRDLTIRDGAIAGVAPSGEPAGVDATVVELPGTYVVPGYADMHAHPLGGRDPTSALALMLVNGVTGFRQMNGSPALLAQRRDGQLRLPQQSPALLAMPGMLLTPFNAGTPEAAVNAVREQVTAGADFIKVGLVTPEAFFPAQAEARRLGIPILGHLPAGIDVAAASRGGMRTIEHLGPGVTMLAACSTDQQTILDAVRAAPTLKLPNLRLPIPERLVNMVLQRLIVNPINMSKARDIDLLKRAVDTFSEAKAQELAARFVEDGTWQVPTLIRVRTQERCDACEYTHDPNLEYMAPATVKRWRGAARKFEKFSAQQRDVFRAVYDLQLRLTGIFDRAGVKMLAGSDCVGAAWEVPGFSLHQEFDQLAAAGLSPLRILQMATRDAAEFLGTSESAGTVDVGKAADLVLLDADPVADVENLHRIVGVVRDGRYYSTVDLDQVKTTVASKSPAN